ncbi:MAG TPA: cytochrome c biogenesis protein CcsA [Terriglobales bacterium]|nr:cytochrome c biogenesis protein CcsA [Terriglobales bacterium]
MSTATESRWFPFAAAGTLALLLIALYWALIGAPTEATMGTIQRIFYYHVPAAFSAWVAFGLNAVASAWYLARRSRQADALAVAGAEVGLAFLTINLITGPIWAHPVWGVWWVWDPRLTLTLAMWVMYASYLILRQLTPPGSLQPRLAAALAIFFAADIPIDYMAIRWWRGQHPAPVLFGGPDSGMAPGIAIALTISLAAFLALMALLVWLRYRQALAQDELRRLRQQQLLEQEA